MKFLVIPLMIFLVTPVSFSMSHREKRLVSYLESRISGNCNRRWYPEIRDLIFSHREISTIICHKQSVSNFDLFNPHKRDLKQLTKGKVTLKISFRTNRKRIKISSKRKSIQEAFEKIIQKVKQII